MKHSLELELLKINEEFDAKMVQQVTAPNIFFGRVLKEADIFAKFLIRLINM